MAAGFERHSAPDPGLGLGTELRPGLALRDGHPGSAAEKERGRRLARPGQADHQHVPSIQIHGHLNFNVARLKKAKMRPRIQNRTTTFSSGQPKSSK